MRAGATLLPGVTLDFTVRKSDKQADRDGFGGPAGTLATAIDDRSTLDHRVFLAGGNLRWDMLGGALTHELRINHNSTITADTDRSFFASFSRNISEAEKYAYLATYRLEHAGAVDEACVHRSGREGGRALHALRRLRRWIGARSADAWPTRASGAATSPTACS